MANGDFRNVGRRAGKGRCGLFWVGGSNEWGGTVLVKGTGLKASVVLERGEVEHMYGY